MSNADLLKARIRNFKRMADRRVVLAFGVEYDTPPDKLEAIPGIIREIVEREEGTRFDRAHFHRFGPSSLDFEVVWFFLSTSYGDFMDAQQRINLALMRRLAAEGVEFAFPTHTVLLRPAAAAEHRDSDGSERAGGTADLRG